MRVVFARFARLEDDSASAFLNGDCFRPYSSAQCTHLSSSVLTRTLESGMLEAGFGI